ncbi:unnamed protein product [Tenebrio molitor]|nr:unnamed protein product [Tenebrio molitor]
MSAVLSPNDLVFRGENYTLRIFAHLSENLNKLTVLEIHKLPEGAK